MQLRYQHLRNYLPNDKARGVLASLGMKMHSGNEINEEGLEILQEQGLVEDWADLAMEAKQHVIASSFLRNGSSG